MSDSEIRTASQGAIVSVTGARKYKIIACAI